MLQHSWKCFVRLGSQAATHPLNEGSDFWSTENTENAMLGLTGLSKVPVRFLNALKIGSLNF